jgi:hypothetical protein
MSSCRIGQAITMDRLAPEELERLIKLLGMLGSARDGHAGLKA